jgi:hypothetical protein
MHSPLPWRDAGRLGHGHLIAAADGQQLAVFYGERTNAGVDADLALALAAVNSHALLAAALAATAAALSALSVRELAGPTLVDLGPGLERRSLHRIIADASRALGHAGVPILEARPIAPPVRRPIAVAGSRGRT